MEPKMERILTALTLSAVLASPAWSTSEGYYILNGGKILYDQTVTTYVDNVPMKAQEVGVTYKGKIYVCQIIFSFVNPTSEVWCMIVEDKGVYEINKD